MQTCSFLLHHHLPRTSGGQLARHSDKEKLVRRAKEREEEVRQLKERRFEIQVGTSQMAWVSSF